jgi:hypothetical protein
MRAALAWMVVSPEPPRCLRVWSLLAFAVSSESLAVDRCKPFDAFSTQMLQVIIEDIMLLSPLDD